MSRIAAEMNAAARMPAGARVGIPPRHIDFHTSPPNARYPFADNAVVTAFHAVLSGIFPPGERFFAESVRRYREHATEGALKAQVAGFMGQEALHGQEHEKLNAHFKRIGFDTAVPDRLIRRGLWLLARLPPSQQLACTCFMEHFTARLGQQLLTDENYRRLVDPEMIKLWQWHALEELEHKAVAFDVYERVGNRQIERRLAMPLVVAALLPPVLLSWAWMVLRDPQAREWREHARGLRLLLGREGFVTPILSKMGVFWRPGFHPAKHDTRELVEQWRQKLFGADGTLRAQVRNPEVLARA